MTEPLTFENAPLGETVGPVTYVIPADFNRKRLAALGIERAALLRAADGREHAEPSLFCGQHSWIMRQRFSWEGSVHARCDIEQMKPVPLGARIHVTGTLSARYERRGGRYVVFRLETTDDDGARVCRVENAMLLNFREVAAARRRSGSDSASAMASSDAEREAPRLALSFGPRKLRREDIMGFFAAEEDVYGALPSIHTRAAIARAAGLPDIIAPGRYSIGLMNCLLAAVYGPRAMGAVHYAVSFLQPLLPGLALQAQAHTASLAGSDAVAPRRAFSAVCRDAVSGKTVLSGSVVLASTIF